MHFPVFIVGCDRSGTTLLRLMLNQSSELHIPQETKFLVNLQKNQELYGDFTRPHQRWFFIRDLQTNQATSKTYTFPIFGLTVEEAEATLAQAAPTDFFGAAAAMFSASACQRNKQRWGDKTPHQIQNIAFLAQAFPDAKFVHMIRDGRDVAISIRKAGWKGGNFLKIARYWKEQVEAGRAAGSSLGSRYFEVYYEQLLRQPETILKELCCWLEIEYTPQMLQYYLTADDNLPKEHSHLFTLAKKPLDSSRAFGWKQTLTNKEIADFESEASDLLTLLGYEIKGVKLPFWYKVARIAKRRIDSALYRANAGFETI